MFGRWLVMCVCLVVLSSLVSAQGLFSEEKVFSKDAASEAYNVELTLQPDATVTKDRGVQLALEWEAQQAHTLVTVTLPSITLAAMRDGRATVSKPVKVTSIKPGTPFRLTILRRNGWLGFMLDEALVFGSEIPRAPGECISLIAGQGWSVTQQVVQPLEAVNFADDFMRAENQGWAAQRGEWALESAWSHEIILQGRGNDMAAASAQNPFAYVGRIAGDKQAWCTAAAGRPFWENYVMTAAVQPADGAVGVLVNMTGPRSGLLVRWSQASDRGPQGNTLALCRLDDGKLTQIASSAGGCIPRQWFKITVTSNLLDGVQVAIDDRVRIPFTKTPLRRGGVGLYAESATGAIFDDIAVFGSKLNTDLLEERRFIRVNQRFQDDPEMKAWAKAQSEWQTWPGVTRQFLHRFDFPGDHWMVANVTPTASSTGKLVMMLNCDEEDANSGYRAFIERTADGKLAYTILRNDAELAPVKEGEPCQPKEEYTFRFSRKGNHLILQRDGETVLEATDPQPLSALRPGYRAEGCFAFARDVLVLGKNVLDYTFTTAPVDWLGEGSWVPSIRWTCAPSWSFLAGWSRGEATLWHKQRFTGNQALQAFMGIKMEYPRERAIYEDRFHSLGITICGDGHNPRSGYTVLFGAPDEQGNPNRRTVLLRNGVEVAASQDMLPDKTHGHHTWFDMVLQKHGGAIEFQVKYVSKNMWSNWDPGREVVAKLSYEDPQPLAGGVPAIWTSDNGITIARMRLFFSGTPQPRTEPLVDISDPAYPEWADRDTPLTVDFPPLWSTEGKQAQLQVETAGVPAGDEQLAVVKGNQVVFTPQKTGEHWYRIFAKEGQYRSPSVHLSLPVFDPAVGRDDSHALLLYRFDEGEGMTAHDSSTVAPAVDLTIPKAANTRWLPGKGLFFTGPTPIMSAKPASKLTALAKTKAFTIECWISPATNDTPTDARGCLLSWGGMGGNSRNFTLYHSWYDLGFSGPNAYYERDGQKWMGPFWGSGYQDMIFHMGLQHVVLTLDGKKAHLYIDGKECRSDGNLSGITDKWNANVPLMLGNLADLSENYIGAYYLVAIHDRSLTPNEVKRHYQAGPAAK